MAPGSCEFAGVVGVVFRRCAAASRAVHRRAPVCGQFNFTRFKAFKSFGGNVVASTRFEPFEVNNFDDISERAMDCQICAGHGTILGRLGAVLWYRCRQCGMLFSRTRAKGEHE